MLIDPNGDSPGGDYSGLRPPSWDTQEDHRLISESVDLFEIGQLTTKIWANFVTSVIIAQLDFQLIHILLARIGRKIKSRAYNCAQRNYFQFPAAIF